MLAWQLLKHRSLQVTESHPSSVHQMIRSSGKGGWNQPSPSCVLYFESNTSFLFTSDLHVVTSRVSLPTAITAPVSLKSDDPSCTETFEIHFSPRQSLMAASTQTFFFFFFSWVKNFVAISAVREFPLATPPAPEGHFAAGVLFFDTKGKLMCLTNKGEEKEWWRVWIHERVFLLYFKC